MSLNFQIKYVYANILEDNEAFKDYNIHQISDQILQEHIAKRDFTAGIILDKKLLIDALQNDGAYFYYDSMRYFDHQKRAFFQLTNSFALDISNGTTKELVLWIKGVNKHNKKRLQNINKRLRTIEKAVECLNRNVATQVTATSTLKEASPDTIERVKTEDPVPLSRQGSSFRRNGNS